MDTTDIILNNETTTFASDFYIDDTDMQNNNESMKYLFVPLAVVITVMILSAMVYLMARRRRINTGYHRRKVPAFSFDTSDRSDDEDYEVESQYLLSRLQTGKMHDSYQHYRANSELYD